MNGSETHDDRPPTPHSGGPSNDPPDPELREWRRALATAAEEARPRQDCPPAEEVWHAVAGELEPQTLETLLDHVATCPVCAEAWDLARELQAEAAAETGEETGEETGATPVADPLARWGVGPPANDEDESYWRPWLQVAALVVVLLGAAVLLPRGFLPDEAPPSVYRGDERPLAALTPGDEPQPKDALVLRWTPWQADGPVRYEVRLYHETAEATWLLMRLVGERTTLEVPPGKVAHIPVGTRLLWEVVVLRDGEEVARRTHPVILGEPTDPAPPPDGAPPAPSPAGPPVTPNGT